MKYLMRIGLQLPKPLLDRLDRILLRDGRRRAEAIRSLIVDFIRSEEKRDTFRSTAGSTAHGITR